MESRGLRRYINEMLPITDWSSEAVRPALILILKRLDRMFNKIHKMPTLRCARPQALYSRSVHFSLVAVSVCFCLPPSVPPSLASLWDARLIVVVMFRCCSLRLWPQLVRCWCVWVYILYCPGGYKVSQPGLYLFLHDQTEKYHNRPTGSWQQQVSFYIAESLT